MSLLRFVLVVWRSPEEQERERERNKGEREEGEEISKGIGELRTKQKKSGPPLRATAAYCILRVASE